MNEKHRVLVDALLQEMPEAYRNMYNEIAEYAISLLYYPKKTKTVLMGLDFFNRKLKKTVLKLEAPNVKRDGNVPVLRLKFYANKEYSNIFQEGVRRVIEGFDGRYTGCYGCGRCSGNLEGYTYVYPDGRKVFRCGGELISIKDWNNEHLIEIKQLIKNQNSFWINQ